MQQLKLIDKIAYLFLLVIFIIAIYLDQTDINYYDKQFAREDGIVENLSALGLFIIPIMLITRLVRMWKLKPSFWRIGLIAMSLLFFFGAGEEISWGQRILGLESGDFFRENNAQGETNLHNLVVGDIKINKLIFSKLMFLALFFYFVIFPFLYKKITLINKLSNQFAIPVARTHHIIVFLSFTGLVLTMDSSRNWEVLELMFAVVFFLIFYRPLNYETIYRAD